MKIETKLKNGFWFVGNKSAGMILKYLYRKDNDIIVKASSDFILLMYKDWHKSQNILKYN